MQRQSIAKLLTATVLTLVSLVFIVFPGQLFGVFGGAATNKTTADTPEVLLTEIAKYRQWTLVNPTPVIMNPRAAADCASRVLEPTNPHESSWASVYVNTKGAKAMATEDSPHFPEGSIIVKEKLRHKLAEKPELLTVMIKRAAGYNPESRDWEYLVLDGPASKVIERGKLGRCNECHEKYVETDFVTMRYSKGKHDEE